MSSGGSFSYGTPSNAAAEIAVVRALYDAFARRDVEAALPYLAPGFEVLPVGTAELVGRTEPYVGADGLRAYLADVERVWSALELRADDVRAIAGSVVVFGTVRGVRAGSDEVVERRLLWTWRLVDGLAVHLRVNDVGG
jgi:ketosteroid isomerase-like protein